MIHSSNRGVRQSILLSLRFREYYLAEFWVRVEPAIQLDIVPSGERYIGGSMIEQGPIERVKPIESNIMAKAPGDCDIQCP
jgi:hypothetical protein